MAEHLNGEQGAADRAYDGVDSVPSRVEPRNFVREKLQEIEDARNRDDHRIPKHFERLIRWRKRNPVEMDGEASGENREIKVDAGEGGQAECNSKQVKLFHGESIGAGESLSRAVYGSTRDSRVGFGVATKRSFD